MNEELHPLRGGQPIRVVERTLSCRFRDEDHFHHVQLYPETGMYQVRWQHRVPAAGSLTELHLSPPTLVFEAETCWYSLHAVPVGEEFRPPWETLQDGDWVPFGGLPGITPAAPPEAC